MKHSVLSIIVIFLLYLTSCTKKSEFSANFDNTHDRVWVGKDLWSIPLEDWKVENGRLYCVGTVPQSRVNLFAQALLPRAGDFEASVKISLNKEGGADPKFFNSSGGLRSAKRDLYEGGSRVPMVANWPGTIKPGQISAHISAF